MGIGVSIFVMAVGAILSFAVEVDRSNGFDVNAAGVILMVIGAIGLLASLILWGPWPVQRRTYVADEEPVVRAPRRRYVDDYVEDEVVVERVPRRRVIREEL